jgi:hypothetical protein
LEDRISSELEKLAAELIAGKAVDWPDYKMRVGRLKGMQEALAFAKEVQKEVLGVERK